MNQARRQLRRTAAAYAVFRPAIAAEVELDAVDVPLVTEVQRTAIADRALVIELGGDVAAVAGVANELICLAVGERGDRRHLAPDTELTVPPGETAYIATG